MFLIIDNYDSFAHNLARYFRQLGAETTIVRNDERSAQELLAFSPTAIVLSPGPCTPAEAGVSLDLVKAAGAETPILGICLGHQTIAQAHGAQIIRVPPVHGKTGIVRHDGRGIFQDIPSPLRTGRYHSLAVHLRKNGPIVPTAWLEEPGNSRVIMAVAHRSLPQVGLQFHPESLLTENGYDLIRNFIEFAEGWKIARQFHKEAAQ